MINRLKSRKEWSVLGCRCIPKPHLQYTIPLNLWLPIPNISILQIWSFEVSQLGTSTDIDRFVSSKLDQLPSGLAPSNLYQSLATRTGSTWPSHCSGVNRKSLVRYCQAMVIRLQDNFWLSGQWPSFESTYSIFNPFCLWPFYIILYSLLILITIELRRITTVIFCM